MSRTTSRIAVMVTTMGVVLAVGGSAQAGITIRTPSLTPDPNGYVQCRVTATSTTPIGIVAAVMTADRTNVTEFGTGFRSSPAANADGLYHADETAGSFNNVARYCKATVSGARRRDVTVILTSYDANYVPIGSVQAQ